MAHPADRAADGRWPSARPAKPGQGRAGSERQHRAAGGLARFQVTVRLLHVFELEAMVDPDEHLAAGDRHEQVVVDQNLRGGGGCWPFWMRVNPVTLISHARCRSTGDW